MNNKKTPDVNERERILTAMVAATWCFLIDEDLATPSELEALTRQALKVIDERGVQTLIDKLQGDTDEIFSTRY